MQSCADEISMTLARRLREGIALAALSLIFIFSGCGGSAGASKGNAAIPEDERQPSVRWLTEITEEVGIDFIHESDAVERYRMPEIMGSGCAFLDYDNDGDLDIYLLSGNHDLSGRTTEPAPRNRLYRQESDGSFIDVTESSGLGDESFSYGVAVGDIDNDGDVDIYITNYGPDRLYQNDGSGSFTDITQQAGINVNGWSCSAAFFDYDRDGFLDLYITRYVIFDPSRECTDSTGRIDYCGPQVFEYYSDVLLHNNGDGTFTDVSERAGMASKTNPGLGVVCEDFNDDGWVDIAVANDGDINFLWINQTDGTFRDEAIVRGIAYNIHGTAEAGMGIIAADFDEDARPDLFMTHLTFQSNTFYRNRGDGTGFDDMTGASGLGATSRMFTGFGVVAFDIELDGDLDLLVANGKVQRGETRADSSIGPPWNDYAEPNLLYVNDGQAKFSPVRDDLSTYSSKVEMTRGLAMGDIDRDGDLDVLFSNNNGPARLYRNDAPRQGHWLMVEAFDPALKRVAIGARVSIHAGERAIHRTIRRSFSYLSSHDPHAHFGLGAIEQIDRIEVLWPDGLRETFAGVPVDQYISLKRGEGGRQP